MKEAIKLGGLKADGKIISADGSLVVTKAAIEPARPQVDTAALTEAKGQAPLCIP